MRSVALLTLDKGSVLLNPAQMPTEVVLKHTDGELIKTELAENGDWVSKRRRELEVNFWEDGRYSSSTDAIATLADRQAFGFRLDGEAVNPLAPGITGTDPETIEIESLDLGGILFEGGRQLPIAVYTTDEVYYRIYRTEEDVDESDIGFEVSVLEKREGPRGEWEEMGRAEGTQISHLVKKLAEDAEMEAVTGDAEAIEEAIENQQELFKASYSEQDEAVRERAAIQNNTAFDPSMPHPRQVEFPGRSQ